MTLSDLAKYVMMRRAVYLRQLSFLSGTGFRRQFLVRVSWTLVDLAWTWALQSAGVERNAKVVTMSGPLRQISARDNLWAFMHNVYITE